MEDLLILIYIIVGIFCIYLFLYLSAMLVHKVGTNATILFFIVIILLLLIFVDISMFRKFLVIVFFILPFGFFLLLMYSHLYVSEYSLKKTADKSARDDLKQKNLGHRLVSEVYTIKKGNYSSVDEARKFWNDQNKRYLNDVKNIVIKELEKTKGKTTIERIIETDDLASIVKSYPEIVKKIKILK